MKKTTKNDQPMLDLFNQIQTQLTELDKKLNTLLNRQAGEIRQAPKPPVNNQSAPVNNTRQMHKAICADCNKECTIPFKPSADRPVYCQDCFSRRKVISMSGLKVGQNNTFSISQSPAVQETKTPDKSKKKAVSAPKAVSKKKPTAKKK